MKDHIYHLLRNGLSIRNISAVCGATKSVIARLRKNLDGLPGTKRLGRPRSLSEKDERFLVRAVTSGTTDTATDAARLLNESRGKKVSPHTVRRAFARAGLRSLVKKKRPRLLPHHRAARLRFALKYRDYTHDDWARVVWSDETKINRLCSDGRQWVWSRQDSPLTDRHVTPTVKFGGGSIMMWGCMTASGVGGYCKIDGRMDSALYCEIMEGELMDSLQKFDLDPEDIIFQHDNDPKHTSNATKACLENLGIEVMEWPAQSPDLNPIEHLWWHVKNELAKFDESATGVEELWQRIQEVWDAIPEETCRALVESMPSRVAAVLAAKGGYTRY
jgi:transposase